MVRMRITKGHRNNRRSHHGLKEPRLSKCVNCSEYHLRHRMCPECGKYNGKEIKDVVAIMQKKVAKKEAKVAALGGHTTPEDTMEEKKETKTKKKTTTKKTEEEK